MYFIHTVLDYENRYSALYITMLVLQLSIRKKYFSKIFYAVGWM